MARCRELSAEELELVSALPVGGEPWLSLFAIGLYVRRAERRNRRLTGGDEESEEERAPAARVNGARAGEIYLKVKQAV
jgi:hypothetical protein